MTTFLASVIAKLSRQGIHDAKDFVRQTESEGYISKEVMGDHVCYLLAPATPIPVADSPEPSGFLETIDLNCQHCC